jgi:hypothetical protein
MIRDILTHVTAGAPTPAAHQSRQAALAHETATLKQLVKRLGPLVAGEPTPAADEPRPLTAAETRLLKFAEVIELSARVAQDKEIPGHLRALSLASAIEQATGQHVPLLDPMTHEEMVEFRNSYAATGSAADAGQEEW